MNVPGGDRPGRGWRVPRRLVHDVPRRPDCEPSPSGPDTELLACGKSRFPADSPASGVPLGFLAVTLMAPAVVYLPYNVPWGPRRISIWPPSRKSSVAAAGSE